MNSNDIDNDNEQPGILTRAQRKKLLEKTVEEDTESDYEEESDNIDNDNVETPPEELQEKLEEEFDDDEEVPLDPLDEAMVDAVTKIFADAIVNKIAQGIDNNIYNDEDDLEDIDELDDIDEDDLDENGYLQDGFVVPDDYDSDEDNDYVPGPKEKKQLKKDRKLDIVAKRERDYETEDEYSEPPAKIQKVTLPSIFELIPFGKPPMSNKLHKMNKEEADTCQQYFDIMKTYGKTSAESYFMKLDLNNKKKVIEQEKTISSQLKTETPLRFQILNSSLPDYIKALAISKVNVIDNNPNGSDFYKLKEWLDGLMKIPFGKVINMPVSLFSPPHQIRQFINESAQILDNAIYGQNNTKTHVIQIISQLISNPDSIGNVFSIYGPMGTGKTSLVKKGIAKALKRPFTLISLGGMTDSSFFRGHSYTYEGSRPGRIVDILREYQCMNPIIYFDELDKVSDTPKGEEIIHTLIHLTDKSQNGNFQDSYYSGIPIDISKTIFIFSYNHEDKINPILRDRMYKISVSGFSIQEKIKIAKNYLLPDIYKNFNFNNSSIFFPDDVIGYIVNLFTKGDNEKVEEGVRNLERCLETIVSKLNVLRLTQNNENANSSFAVFPGINTGLHNPNQMLEKETNINIIDVDDDITMEIEKDTDTINSVYETPFSVPNLQFPLIITTQIVDGFLTCKPVNTFMHSMYT